MTYHARVDAEGRVLLPAELARALGLKPGDSVAFDAADGMITVKTYRDVVRDGQAKFRAMLGPDFDGRSLADELIADRRAEAEQEESEMQEMLARRRDAGSR